jgi:sarcosine oxidase gamma subunit
VLPHNASQQIHEAARILDLHPAKTPRKASNTQARFLVLTVTRIGPEQWLVLKESAKGKAS